MTSHKVMLTLISATIFLSGVHSLKMESRHKKLTAVVTDIAEIHCKVNAKVDDCLFRSPYVKNYLFSKGVSGRSYLDGRLTDISKSEWECSLRITSVEERDHGTWECTAFVTNDQGDPAEVKNSTEIEVAVAPQSVALQIDGDRISANGQTQRFQLQDYANGQYADVACVASETRPAPTFKWFMDDTPLSADVTDTDVEGAEGNDKRTYTQIIKYYPKANHDGKQLMCKVDHIGFREAQKEVKSDEAFIQLAVLYPPKDIKPKTFYLQDEDEEKVIRMHIRANPKPTGGKWHIGGKEVAVGAESLDRKLKSSDVESGIDLDGDWVVSLTIMNLDSKDGSPKGNFLEVTNSEGTQKHEFELRFGPKPTAGGGGSPIVVPNDESSSGLAIGVVVVIVLIILLLILVVVARSKGMLCFAAKSEDEQDEEKQAFENVEKGEAAPIVQDSKAGGGGGGGDAAKASPEKKIITSASTESGKKEEAADAEEKRSNGTRTPN